MNNLFTTLVTGLALLFTLSIQANSFFPAFTFNNADIKSSIHEANALMDDFTLSGSSASGEVGDIVCIDVTVDNFDNILSFQHSINFDQAVLQYNDIIESGNVPDLNFGLINTATGNISVLWFDEDDAMGETFPDGTVLFQLCFNIIGNPGSPTTIAFTGNPTPIEVVDGNEDPVGFASNSGSISVGGAVPLSVSSTSASAVNGDNVCLTITANNFTNLASFQYSMNFNASVLQFSQFMNPGNLTGLMLNSSGAGNGNLTMTWSSGSGVTLANGTSLYQVCFNVIGASGTSSTIAFSGNPTSIAVTDATGGSVQLVSTNGSVNVTGGGGGGGGGNGTDFTVSVETATGNVGDQICLDVTADNFDDILSFQYSMNFNPAVLQFDQIIEGSTVPDLNFGLINAAIGNISVLWFDEDDAMGETFPDGTVLYQICFTVLTTGNGIVSFSGNPTPIEVVDGNEDPVVFASNSGGINPSGGGGGGTGNGTDFTVSATTPVGNIGDVVCIDVTVDNFDNILSFQYSMNFNPALLQFNDIIDPGNVPDLNFGETGAAMGNLTVSWFDDNVMGVTYPDGTLLYQVCFTVLGGNGVVPVSFSGTPTSIEVVDGNEDPVVFASNSGGINVGGTPPVPTLTVSAPNVTAENGDQVCLDIKVNGFTNIASFQYTVNFNPAILAFASNMNSNVLTGLNFNNSGAGSGTLTVSWNNNGTGVNLNNGTTIYKICFNVIGAGGTSSNVSFSNGTVTNGSAASVVFAGTNGSVNVMNLNNGTDFIVSGSDELGEVGDQVCVEVTVENFNNILSFQYSMNFNPAILQFVGVNEGPTVPDLNFGVINAAIGNISILWFDEDDAMGETFPDGTVLYEVCFTIISGTNGTTTNVSFSGNPTPVEVTDGNEDPVVFGNSTGTVTIGTPTLPPVIFSAPTTTANSGTNVCVDITTNDFDNIGSFQYSMNFNPAVLTFDQNTSSGNLSNIMFNNSGAASGNLVVTWNNNGTGITLADGTVLYQLCFNAIGAAGTSSNLTFSSNPTTQMAANGSGNNIPVSANNGSITILASQCQGPITIASQMVTNVSPCAGANNGQITITDAGGNGAGLNSYSWIEVGNPAVIATTINLSSVGAGMYQLTITGCNGDETLTQVFTITEPNPVVLTANPTPVTCNGTNTGAITTMASGGSGGFTYAWNPSVISGANPTGLLAGTYSVTVSDSNGCTASFGPITVTEPAAFTGSATPTNPACFGQLGSITVSATGGTMGYTFTLNNGTPQSNPTFNNLTAGNYNVNATDANGCTFAVPNIAITVPAQVVITEDSSTNDLGNCEGSIGISVTGGNPGGFTYSWTGPSGPFSTQDISGLCGGQYCVTVTDNVGGCTATFCKTLIQPLAVSLVSSTNACTNTCNGTAIIDIVGGDNNYTISWMPGGQTTINPTNLCDGPNTVTVTSGDGQTAMLVVNIAEPTSPLAITNPILVNPSSATACTGSITITPTGGYGGPYGVSWTPAQTGTTTISNLCAGTYTAVITDSNDCTATASYTLVTPDLEIVGLVSTPTSCGNDDDGTISFSVIGGATPYLVTVTGGNAGTPISTNPYVYNGLQAGVYLINVTDGAVDIVTTTVEVISTGEIMTEIIKVVDATSSTLGSIQITQPTGGTPPYTYMWSNGSTAMNPENLNPGIYSLTITDGAGCFVTLVDFATVYSLKINTAVLTDPPCSGSLEGSIAVTATATINNPPLVYAWENASGNPVGTNSSTLEGVAGGTYKLTVTDACGTSFTETYVLVAESILMMDVTPTSFFTGFNVRCNGGSSGGALADITTGTAPYAYIWSTGGTNSTISNVPAGTYAVTVTDAVGCTATGETLLTQPTALSVSFSIDSISCNGAGDGFITAIAAGGVNLGGYDYFWNNGEADNTVGPVGPGNYTIEITDTNDCTTSAMVPLPEPAVLNFTFATTPVTETALGSIQLFPTGGTQPYFYTWPAGVAGEDLVEGLNFGTYAVIITDANGCTKMNTGIQVQLNTDCFEGAAVITPNDDSLNDFFKITCSDRVRNLEIFNRWGQLVYEADTYADEWDGKTRRGTEVPEGTYFYIFEYEDANTGETEQKRGHLTLLRN